MAITVLENYGFNEDVLSKLDPKDWAGKPILDLIPEYIVSSDVTLQVIHNTDELTEEELLERVIADEDHIRIRVVPRDPAIIGPILVTTIVGLAVGYAVQAIINAIVGPPKKPKKDVAESPTYDFDSPRNTTANGTPVSLVYGQLRVAGQILQAKTVVLPDGRTAIRMLFGLGEGGDAGWKSICGFTTNQTNVVPPDSLEINDNPASTYKDVTFSCRLGTKHQGIIPTFSDTILLTTGYDILLTYNVEQVIVGTNHVDSLEVKLRFPGGLFGLSSKGNLISKTVTFDIRWKTQGLAYLGTVPITITRATRQEFTYSYRIDGRDKTITDIGIKRTTVNDATTTEFSEMRLFEVNEITNDDLAYPGLALASVEALATDQLHGAQPTVTFLVEAALVRVYTTTSAYTIIYSRNPSWIIFDLLTNAKYGLGKYISIADCDIQSFIDFAAYCDQLALNGSEQYETRCVCDISIDTRKSAWDWIYEIAQSAQASIFSIGGIYRIRADQTTSSVMMFTPGNIKSIRFGYTPIKDRINYVEATFPNSANNYRKDYVIGLDTSIVDVSNYNKESIEFLPVTRKNQAMRLANYRINANRFLTRYVVIEADISAVRCEPNDVIEVMHASAAWGLYAGRVTGATTSAVFLDQEVVLESSKQYSIRVFHTDGTFETKVIIQSPGTWTGVGVAGNWVSIPVQYEPYSLAESITSIKQFKVTDISMGADMSMKISAVEYNPLVYSDVVIAEPTQELLTGFNPGEFPPDVLNLLVKERIYQLPDGGLDRVLDVSFNPPLSPIYAHADIWMKFHADATWPITPIVSVVKGGYAAVTGNFQTGDSIDIAVSSASTFGIRKHPSLSVTYNLTLTSSTHQPADVTGFAASRYGDALAFSWTQNPDTDIDYYEIRNSSVNTWASSVLVAKVAATAFDTNIFFASPTTYTTYFLIKAVNTGGNSSINASSVTLIIDPKVDQNIVIAADYRRGVGTNISVAADWATGTTTNFTLTGSTPKTLGVTTVGTQSVFETTEIDVGSILHSRVTVYAVATQIDPTLDWASSNFTWASATALSRTWSGPISSSSISTQIQWKFGATSGAGTYAAFSPSEQTFRYARFKVLLDVTDIAYDAELTELQTVIDVPDVFDAQTISGNSPLSVTYTKTFTQTAKIAKVITIKNGVRGDYHTITGETTSGFTIHTFNSEGTEYTATSRTIDLVVHGY